DLLGLEGRGARGDQEHLAAVADRITDAVREEDLVGDDDPPGCRAVTAERGRSLADDRILRDQTCVVADPLDQAAQREVLAERHPMVLLVAILQGPVRTPQNS